MLRFWDAGGLQISGTEIAPFPVAADVPRMFGLACRGIALGCGVGRRGDRFGGGLKFGAGPGPAARGFYV